MSKKALTDAGVGRAIFATRFRLSLQAALMCIYYGLVPGLLLPFALWYAFVQPKELALIQQVVVEKILPDAAYMRLHIALDNGEKRVLVPELADGTLHEWMHPPAARVYLDEKAGYAKQQYLNFATFALVTGPLGYLLIWFVLRRFGTGAQDNTRIRGASDTVSASDLSRLSKKLGSSGYTLVDVALPRAALTTGIIALGSQGSGKSFAINDLLLQVFAKGRKCIIYDQSSEYFKAHYRPEKDFFFNPSLVGSVPWSIFSEMVYTYDADTLARAFLPPANGAGGGSGEFFRDAARALFAVLLVKLRERGAVNTADLAKAFMEMPAADMDHLIQNTIASSSVGGDSKQQRQGVLSSISIYLNGLAAVQPGNWSIRDFLNGPEDSRLFIVSTDTTKAMFDPLFRLLLTTAFAQIASAQNIVHEDRYWFVLDEVHALGDIRLDEQLATMRKFGVCIVTGAQSESQFVTSLGRERADTVMNCLQTALLLQASEPNMQERIAKRLGRVEVQTVNRNQALAVDEARDGAGLNSIEAEKWAVMPSDIGALDPCTGYLKLVGSMPAAWVDYRSWNQESWRSRPRREGWAPKRALPPKNPDFKLAVAPNSTGLDAIRAEVALERQTAAAAAAALQSSLPPSSTPPSPPSSSPQPSTQQSALPQPIAEQPVVQSSPAAAAGVLPLLVASSTGATVLGAVAEVSVTAGAIGALAAPDAAPVATALDPPTVNAPPIEQDGAQAIGQIGLFGDV